MQADELAALLEQEYGFDRAVQLCLSPERECADWRRTQPYEESLLTAIGHRLAFGPRATFPDEPPLSEAELGRAFEFAFGYASALQHCLSIAPEFAAWRRTHAYSELFFRAVGHWLVANHFEDPSAVARPAEPPTP